MRIIPCCLAIVAGWTAIAAPVVANDYLRMRHVSEPFEIMGRTEPAADEVIDIWIAGDRARMDSGDASSVIVREDLEVLYVLDHGEQTWMEVPMDVNRMVAELAGGNENARMAAQFMGSFLKVNAKVEETGERRTVRDWDCQVYRMTVEMAMARTESEICASDKVGLDMGLYFRLGNVMLAGQQGFQEAVQEIEKIRGLPITSTSTVTLMGSRITSKNELLVHDQVKAPPGSFEVPAGYVQRPFSPL